MSSVNTTYTVKSGDNLSKIAHNFGKTVEELKKLNPSLQDPKRIRKNKNGDEYFHIQPNETITIIDPPTTDAQGRSGEWAASKTETRNDDGQGTLLIDSTSINILNLDQPGPGDQTYNESSTTTVASNLIINYPYPDPGYPQVSTGTGTGNTESVTDISAAAVNPSGTFQQNTIYNAEMSGLLTTYNINEVKSDTANTDRTVITSTVQPGSKFTSENITLTNSTGNSMEVTVISKEGVALVTVGGTKLSTIELIGGVYDINVEEARNESEENFTNVTITSTVQEDYPYQTKYGETTESYDEGGTKTNYTEYSGGYTGVTDPDADPASDPEADSLLHQTYSSGQTLQGTGAYLSHVSIGNYAGAVMITYDAQGTIVNAAYELDGEKFIQTANGLSTMDINEHAVTTKDYQGTETTVTNTDRQMGAIHQQGLATLDLPSATTHQEITSTLSQHSDEALGTTATATDIEVTTKNAAGTFTSQLTITDVNRGQKVITIDDSRPVAVDITINGSKVSLTNLDNTRSVNVQENRVTIERTPDGQSGTRTTTFDFEQVFASGEKLTSISVDTRNYEYYNRVDFTLDRTSGDTGNSFQASSEAQTSESGTGRVDFTNKNLDSAGNETFSAEGYKVYTDNLSAARNETEDGTNKFAETSSEETRQITDGYLEEKLDREILQTGLINTNTHITGANQLTITGGQETGKIVSNEASGPNGSSSGQTIEQWKNDETLEGTVSDRVDYQLTKNGQNIGSGSFIFSGDSVATENSYAKDTNENGIVTSMATSGRSGIITNGIINADSTYHLVEGGKDVRTSSLIKAENLSGSADSLHSEIFNPDGTFRIADMSSRDLNGALSAFNYLSDYSEQGAASIQTGLEVTLNAGDLFYHDESESVKQNDASGPTSTSSFSSQLDILNGTGNTTLFSSYTKDTPTAQIGSTTNLTFPVTDGRFTLTNGAAGSTSNLLLSGGGGGSLRKDITAVEQLTDGANNSFAFGVQAATENPCMQSISGSQGGTLSVSAGLQAATVEVTNQYDLTSAAGKVAQDGYSIINTPGSTLSGSYLSAPDADGNYDETLSLNGGLTFSGIRSVSDPANFTTSSLELGLSGTGTLNYGDALNIEIDGTGTYELSEAGTKPETPYTFEITGSGTGSLRMGDDYLLEMTLNSPTLISKATDAKGNMTEYNVTANLEASIRETASNNIYNNASAFRGDSGSATTINENGTTQWTVTNFALSRRNTGDQDGSSAAINTERQTWETGHPADNPLVTYHAIGDLMTQEIRVDEAWRNFGYIAIDTEGEAGTEYLDSLMTEDEKTTIENAINELEAADPNGATRASATNGIPATITRSYEQQNSKFDSITANPEQLRRDSSSTSESYKDGKLLSNPINDRLTEYIPLNTFSQHFKLVATQLNRAGTGHNYLSFDWKGTGRSSSEGLSFSDPYRKINVWELQIGQQTAKRSDQLVFKGGDLNTGYLYTHSWNRRENLTFMAGIGIYNIKDQAITYFSGRSFVNSDAYSKNGDAISAAHYDETNTFSGTTVKSNRNVTNIYGGFTRKYEDVDFSLYLNSHLLTSETSAITLDITNRDKNDNDSKRILTYNAMIDLDASDNLDFARGRVGLSYTPNKYKNNSIFYEGVVESSRPSDKITEHGPDRFTSHVVGVKIGSASIGYNFTDGPDKGLFVRWSKKQATKKKGNKAVEKTINISGGASGTKASIAVKGNTDLGRTHVEWTSQTDMGFKVKSSDPNL